MLLGRVLANQIVGEHFELIRGAEHETGKEKCKVQNTLRGTEGAFVLKLLVDRREGRSRRQVGKKEIIKLVSDSQMQVQAACEMQVEATKFKRGVSSQSQRLGAEASGRWLKREQKAMHKKSMSSGYRSRVVTGDKWQPGWRSQAPSGHGGLQSCWKRAS